MTTYRIIQVMEQACADLPTAQETLSVLRQDPHYNPRFLEIEAENIDDPDNTALLQRLDAINDTLQSIQRTMRK